MHKFLVLIIFLVSFSSEAGTLEFWSAFGDNVDQKLAKEFEIRTGNKLMVRSSLLMK